MADELLRRFGLLNPVPDPDRLVAFGGPDWSADPVLRAILDREATTDGRAGPAHTDGRTKGRRRPQESPMPTLTPTRHDDQPHGGPDRRRRWAAPAAAGVVAILILAGGVAILASSEPTEDVTDPPAPTAPDPSDPAAVAEAYLTARDGYDAQAARALLADEVRIDKASFRELDELEPAFQALEIYGFRVSPFACEGPDETVAPGEAAAVRCSYTLDSRLQRIVDHPPIQAAFRFTVEDGLITRMFDEFPYDTFDPEVWAPWVRWLNAEHAGAFNELFRRGTTGSVYFRLEPEALEAAADYLDEYESWVEAQQE
jgi:hypothetical protein